MKCETCSVITVTEMAIKFKWRDFVVVSVLCMFVEKITGGDIVCSS